MAPKPIALRLVAGLIAFGSATALLASPVILAPTQEPAAERELRRSIRELPGLAERWRCDCRPKEVAVENGVVYALGWRRMFALDAANGSVVWDGGVEAQTASASTGLLVLADRVAAVFGEELVIRDRASGLEIARVALGGRPEQLVGSPLAVAWRMPEAATVEEIVRVDPGSGQVLARRQLPGAPHLIAADGGLFVAAWESDRGTLATLDPATLATSAEWAIPGGHPAGTEHGRPRFVDRSEEVLTIHLLDPAAGTWSTRRLAAEEGGSAMPGDGGLATAAPGWNGQPRALLALDGAGNVRWATRLPCRPGSRMRAAGEVVLACGWMEGGSDLLLRIDADTGEVVETLRGPGGRTRGIAEGGGLWIVASDEGIAGLDPTSRTPPLAETEPVDVALDRILGRISGGSGYVHPDSVEALHALGDAALPAMVERLPEASLPQALALARVLGSHRYRAAGPPLAAGIEQLAKAEDEPPGGDSTWRTLLEALAETGDARHAAVVGPILVDPSRPPAVREAAAFTLAAFDDPAVLPWFAKLDREAAPGGAAAVETASSPAEAPGAVHADAADEEERAIRRALRAHGERYARHGLGLCAPGEAPEPRADPWDAPTCLGFRVEEPSALEGAKEVVAALPAQPGDRYYAVVHGESPYREVDLVRVRQVGDRWLVRSVWRWMR